MDERTPITIGPEQRYWRRRANRRVRKKRMTRSLLRVCRGLVLHTSIVAVVLFGAWRAFQHLADSRALDLTRVDLRGVERAAEPPMREALGGLVGRSLMELDLDEVAELVRRDVWVDDARIRRILPGTLCVELEERTPGALALIDGTPFVIDSKGRTVGEVGPGLWEDLPVLIGLDGLEDGERSGRLEFGLDVLERLHEVSPSFAAGISELDLSLKDRITVLTVVPGPRLVLDPQAVERNVRHWLRHRDGIVLRIGGAEYVDLRWRDRITVMPSTHQGA